MDDPDNINGYWDSLPERDGDDIPSPPPLLRVVDDEVEAAIAAEREQNDLTLPGAIDIASWHGRNAPERSFVMHGWIARGHAGLLSGMEGVGKSLAAQQLATCIAAGIPYLGLTVEQCAAAYITCEDSEDELWRRQEAINKMLGLTMANLAGKLFLRSLLGQQNNELGTFDAEGRINATPRFKQIEAEAERNDWGFIVLDNAAHLFAGNENARHDVAAFLGLLERLSQRINGAALLLAHPNKQFAQGNSQGNEYSGSTGWSAHVRNRLFLDYRGTPEDGSASDDDERILRKSKANYGKRGEEIIFRWQDWAFVRPEDLGDDRAREIAEVSLANTENERFLECLDKKTKERVNVSVRSAASNYAPRLFARMTTAKGMKIEQFERAMERLLHLEIIIGEGAVFKRDNRSFAMGIVRSGGAQTLHKPSQKFSDGLCKKPNENNAKGAAQSGKSGFAQTAHKATQNHAQSRSAQPPYPKGVIPGEDYPPGFDPLEQSGDWRDNPALNSRWEDEP